LEFLINRSKESAMLLYLAIVAIIKINTRV